MLLIRGLVALALMFGVAAAREIPTGTAQRVTRPRRSGLPHLVFVQSNGGPRDIVLLGVAGPITAGDLYDVVDSNGWSGMVKVTRVEVTDDRCQGFFYQRASTATVEVVPPLDHPAARGGAVAVGPVRDPARAARFVATSSPNGLPPPGASEALTNLVDLDGDGRPKLARYLYECRSGPRRPWVGGGSACIDDWGRDGPGGIWRRQGHVEFSCPR